MANEQSSVVEDGKWVDRPAIRALSSEGVTASNAAVGPLIGGVTAETAGLLSLSASPVKTEAEARTFAAQQEGRKSNFPRKDARELGAIFNEHLSFFPEGDRDRVEKIANDGLPFGLDYPCELLVSWANPDALRELLASASAGIKALVIRFTQDDDLLETLASDPDETIRNAARERSRFLAE